MSDEMLEGTENTEVSTEEYPDWYADAIREYGMTDEEEPTPDTGEPAEAEAQEEEAPAEEDPWAWLKDKDPNQVRPTVEKFTQAWEEERKKQEELAKKEQELQPYMQLKDELETNPELFKVISEFMESGRAPEAYINELRTEMRQMQTQLQVERELSDLHLMVQSKGLPDFQDEDIIQHAINIGAPDMAVAYRDYSYDKAQELAKEKVIKDIKASKGVQPPKAAAGDTPIIKAPSVNDIANMPEAEFLKQYGDILGQMQKGGRRPSI